MGRIGPRPPAWEETEEEGLKRDIEYYQKHIMMNKKMSIIMLVAVAAFLIIILIATL